MSRSQLLRRARVAFALLSMPALAHAQSTLDSRVQVAVGGGLMTSGTYFSGPGGLELAGADALAGSLQASMPVHRSLRIVVGGSYAAPDFRLTGVPLLGSVGLSGAHLWFADAALRGQLPLAAASPTAPVAFAQVGAGLAHYSVNATVLGNAIDESATNFAGSLGVGLGLAFTERLGVEVMAKDYIASFKSVDDLAAFGVEGRRTHTLLLSVSARLGL
ncbi:MAG TPA: hypothetical protein VMY76_12890 [Gemmatimonadales bacterium]|nr:hypothetical protein [Gemmatimonadales bacterium]